MRTKLLVSMTALTLMALPFAAQAQGTFRGAQEGAEEGGRAAGPLGAVVGGTVGAAAGTVGGILGVEDRPRFREYASAYPHIATSRNFASVQSCPSRESRIMRCRLSTT
jgi:phage tail tape-measure protein